jgi:predicted secreted hydrolase
VKNKNKVRGMWWGPGAHAVASIISILLFCVFVSVFPARAQTPQTSFRAALPGYKFSFPRDHGSHGAFQTEWWYYTGHLKSKSGRRFGYQLTFFRTALVPAIGKRTSKWAVRDVMFAHFAISDINGRRFFNTDRISRKILNLAGADEAGAPSPRIWIGDWTLRFGGASGERQTMRAAGTSNGTAFSLSLTQRQLKPPVIQGTNGVSQKSAGAGRASHYYSLTRLASSGTVQIGGETFAVTGQSWFDHEFGSNQMSKNQTGWDWFSLQLSDGRELMLYQLRLSGGRIEPYSSGTLVEKDGRARHLKLSEFQIQSLATWRSPRSGGVYPAKWRVRVPRENIDLTITPSLADQELNTKRGARFDYWEGSVDVTGTQSGQGYVELTGYSRPMGGTF